MAVLKIRHATWGLSDRETLMFLKFDMRHKSHSDMRHDHFFNFDRGHWNKGVTDTCDIGFY